MLVIALFASTRRTRGTGSARKSRALPTMKICFILNRYTFFNGESFSCTWDTGTCAAFDERQAAVRAAPDQESARARAAADAKSKRSSAPAQPSINRLLGIALAASVAAAALACAVSFFNRRRL